MRLGPGGCSPVGVHRAQFAARSSAAGQQRASRGADSSRLPLAAGGITSGSSGEPRWHSSGQRGEPGARPVSRAHLPAGEREATGRHEGPVSEWRPSRRPADTGRWPLGGGPGGAASPTRERPEFEIRAKGRRLGRALRRGTWRARCSTERAVRGRPASEAPKSARTLLQTVIGAARAVNCSELPQTADCSSQAHCSLQTGSPARNWAHSRTADAHSPLAVRLVFAQGPNPFTNTQMGHKLSPNSHSARAARQQVGSRWALIGAGCARGPILPPGHPLGGRRGNKKWAAPVGWANRDRGKSPPGRLLPYTAPVLWYTEEVRDRPFCGPV